MRPETTGVLVSQFKGPLHPQSSCVNAIRNIAGQPDFPLPGDKQGVSVIPRLQQIRSWSPTEGSLRQFLNWLDEGNDSAGERYLEMRRRLVSYFDRKNCDHPDDLADETLNRVMRRLEEEGSIDDTPPARYCYIVAKFVFLEELRRPKRCESDFERMDHLRSAVPTPQGGHASELALQEQMLESLDCCLKKLDPQDRELILNYYQGEQRAKIDARREIASRLGLTMNALSIRACRIRSRLEACLQNCDANS